MLELGERKHSGLVAGQRYLLRNGMRSGPAQPRGDGSFMVWNPIHEESMRYLPHGYFYSKENPTENDLMEVSK